jgi:hypothetical protein
VAIPVSDVEKTFNRIKNTMPQPQKVIFTTNIIYVFQYLFAMFTFLDVAWFKTILVPAPNWKIETLSKSTGPWTLQDY